MLTATFFHESLTALTAACNRVSSDFGETITASEVSCGAAECQHGNHQMVMAVIGAMADMGECSLVGVYLEETAFTGY